ncbi:unnamed protein product [Discosporangium mesarthrocarpum]
MVESVALPREHPPRPTGFPMGCKWILALFLLMCVATLMKDENGRRALFENPLGQSRRNIPPGPTKIEEKSFHAEQLTGDGVEELLRPLLGQCFTWRVKEEAIAYQWCHGRRVTMFWPLNGARANLVEVRVEGQALSPTSVKLRVIELSNPSVGYKGGDMGCVLRRSTYFEVKGFNQCFEAGQLCLTKSNLTGSPVLCMANSLVAGSPPSAGMSVCTWNTEFLVATSACFYS